MELQNVERDGGQRGADLRGVGVDEQADERNEGRHRRGDCRSALGRNPAGCPGPEHEADGIRARAGRRETVIAFCDAADLDAGAPRHFPSAKGKDTGRRVAGKPQFGS